MDTEIDWHHAIDGVIGRTDPSPSSWPQDGAPYDVAGWLRPRPAWPQRP